jgi:DNA helicase-2/ATP-dependent DNA helicase PcrA
MDLEADLNPEQRAAVLHGEGPLLILAGAGSGKTRVITYRIAHLIQARGVNPHQILAVTFTNKAAGEMRDRLDQLVGSVRGLWVLTFHAFGSRFLRRHAELLGYDRDFVIYDENDSRRLGRECLKELNLDPALFPVERMLGRVELAKRRLKAPGEGGIDFGPATAFYTLYQKRLAKANAFDFADLIFQTQRLLAKHTEVLNLYRERFRHVLVDEYQDTDPAQYQLLRLLCPDDTNLCVVGDDDQSIYQWRGADVNHILKFESDYPAAQVVKLERNYRSCANILEVAHSVIARNPSRHQKRLWTERESGALIDCVELNDERAEGDWVAKQILASARDGRKPNQLAVFYRVNAQSRAVEESLQLYGVAYIVVGGVRFFDRMEIRDLISYLRLLQNKNSDVDLLRVLNVPTRGIGDTTRQRLQDSAKAKGCTLYEALDPTQLPDLRKPEREKVLKFKELLDRMRASFQAFESGTNAVSAIDLVLSESGYAAALEREGTDEAAGRLENLRELSSAAIEFASTLGDSSLTGFLEHIALITDIDQAENGAAAVTLMTLHSAKGLEFEEVFMVGMEDGLLPHRRSIYSENGDLDPEWLEEERRLCYVGMTRARERLHLSFARSRMIFGHSDENRPSRFLDDIPGRLLTRQEISAVAEIIQPARVKSGERYIDTSNEFSQAPKFRENDPRSWIGQYVVHATFGRGRVRDAMRYKNDEFKLVVDFNSEGRKTVLASYIKLT